MSRRGLCLAVVVLALTGCDDSNEKGRPARSPRPPAASQPPAEAFHCPQGEGSEQGFDARTLAGMTLAAAEVKAADHGCTVRPVQRDGRQLVVTQDLLSNRINVIVARGKVLRVERIG